MSNPTPGTDRRAPGGRSSRRRGRHSRYFRLLVAVLILTAGAACLYLNLQSVPAPATVLAKMSAAGDHVGEISCVLRSPWPEAYSAGAQSPGARVLLAPADTARAWAVAWKASVGFRAEALEPPGAAGSLSVASGGRWWTYNPMLGIALSAEGEVPSLFLGEIAEMLAAGSDLRVTGKTEVRGRTAFTVAAAVGDNRLVVDVDRESWLPLRAKLTGEGGRLLAELEVEDLEVNPGLDWEEFSFEPPPGTRVLGGAFPRSFPDLETAAGDLPFEPKQPGWLPAGFRLSAVNVIGEGKDRALVLTWTHGGGPAGTGEGAISLTEALAGSEYAPLTCGRPEQRGAVKAMVFELGEMYVVDWRQGDLSLTLFGSVPTAHLLDIAASLR